MFMIFPAIEAEIFGAKGGERLTLHFGSGYRVVTGPVWWNW